MSMILTAYNVIKPLPPEGSEEWLAMLPGWTGWKYYYGDGGPRHYFVTTFWDRYVDIVDWNDTYIVYPGSGSGYCSRGEIETYFIGDYEVIIPCDSGIISGYPKFYIRDKNRQRANGGTYYYAVAGVDSLALE